jgi:ATP-dependent DNA helicase RecG
MALLIPEQESLRVEFKSDRKRLSDRDLVEAAVYRRIGQPNGYVRQAGFDPIQQEQMVLQFVKKNGEITRKDVAGLCQINENQASHLLRKLHKSGKLELIGSGRGAYYRAS